MSDNTKRHSDESREELPGEIQEFEREREQLREVLGRIGGRSFSRKDNWINIGFLVLIPVLIVLDSQIHRISNE